MAIEIANASGTPIQKNHYYPFGMAFAEGTTQEQGKQPYKYNGKELDQMHGLNLYDYSARYYEPAIGRFTTVDPLAEKFYSWSPYVYCYNSPINYVDPDGKWGIKIHYSIAANTMKSLGYDSQTADRLAYYASTYADQPLPLFTKFDKHLAYGRHGTRRGDREVANSQNNDANSWRHAMMSDDEFGEGKTREWAIERTIGNAWNEIIRSIEGGDEKRLGVGLHALQDISAHGGISNNEHLGINNSSIYYVKKDSGTVGTQDQQEAYRVTKGVMSLYGVLSGNQKVINNLKDKKGTINIDLKGITNVNAQVSILKLLQKKLKSSETLNVRIEF